MEERSHLEVGGGGIPRLSQWSQTSVGLAMHAALPALVFARADPGYNVLGVGAIVGVTIALLLRVVCQFWPVVWAAALIGIDLAPGPHDADALRYFALAFLVYALWQRARQKKLTWDLSSEHRSHSDSHGRSYFAAFLPFPDNIVRCFVDTAVVAIAAALLRYSLGLPLLGLAVMVSAGCFLIVELKQEAQIRKHDRVVLDGFIQGRHDQDVLRHAAGARQQTSGTRAAQGIPTGMDANLEREVRRREAEGGVQ